MRIELYYVFIGNQNGPPTVSPDSTGLLGKPLMRYMWARERAPGRKRKYRFKRWLCGPASAPVTQVTPRDGFYAHTYYDVCPFSPSQLYLAVTCVPYQVRIPVQGVTADVCVIDLQEQTIETVYTNKSWGFQTGTNTRCEPADAKNRGRIRSYGEDKD